MNSISATDVVHNYLIEQKLAEQFTLVETLEAAGEKPLTLLYDADLSHIQTDADFLKNNAEVQEKINTLYGAKEKLMQEGIAAEVRIRKISLKGSNVSGRSLLSVYESDNKTFVISPNILEQIQSLNMSHTCISSKGLEKIYALKGLTIFKLDYCKSITEILSPKVICPSLQKLSLVGTSIELHGGWQRRLEKKFPNLTCVDVTLGKSVKKSPGLYDSVTLATCVNARIYYPCGHLFGLKSRVNHFAPCGHCRGEILDIHPVEKHITRFEKKPDNSWQSTVVDIKRKPLKEGQIYFHMPCQQFFNEETLNSLYGESILEQVATTDALCIGCLQQGAPSALKGLFKAYPTLTEKGAQEKSQNLTTFACPRYINAVDV